MTHIKNFQKYSINEIHNIESKILLVEIRPYGEPVIKWFYTKKNVLNYLNSVLDMYEDENNENVDTIQDTINSNVKFMLYYINATEPFLTIDSNTMYSTIIRSLS